VRTVKIYVREAHPGEPGIPPCMPCRLTKNLLDHHHIQYDTINILLPENRETWKMLQAAGHTQLPVVMISNNGSREGECWTGFRPEKIRGLKAP
jgi:glutaredoxin